MGAKTDEEKLREMEESKPDTEKETEKGSKDEEKPEDKPEPEEDVPMDGGKDNPASIPPETAEEGQKLIGAQDEPNTEPYNGITFSTEDSWWKNSQGLSQQEKEGFRVEAETNRIVATKAQK